MCPKYVSSCDDHSVSTTASKSEVGVAIPVTIDPKGTTLHEGNDFWRFDCRYDIRRWALVKWDEGACNDEANDSICLSSYFEKLKYKKSTKVS